MKKYLEIIVVGVIGREFEGGMEYPQHESKMTCFTFQCRLLNAAFQTCLTRIAVGDGTAVSSTVFWLKCRAFMRPVSGLPSNTVDMGDGDSVSLNCIGAKILRRRETCFRPHNRPRWLG